MVSQHALQVVSQHALQQVSGGGSIPACLAGFQAHTQGGSSGVWPGGLQAHTQGGACSRGVFGDPPVMATAVGGMHSTGMHSCC